MTSPLLPAPAPVYCLGCGRLVAKGPVVNGFGPSCARDRGLLPAPVRRIPSPRSPAEVNGVDLLDLLAEQTTEPAPAPSPTPAPTVQPHRTCPPCRALADKWLYSNPARVLGGGVRIASGAAYDDTAAGVADNRRGRYEQWRRLVREQIALIVEGCEAGRHVPSDS